MDHLYLNPRLRGVLAQPQTLVGAQGLSLEEQYTWG